MIGITERARLALRGFHQHTPGENVDRLIVTLDRNGRIKQSVFEWDAKAVLGSAARFLTEDWATHPDREENFGASCLVLECLEKIR